MPTLQKHTVVTLSEDQCSVLFSDGTQLTVTKDGAIAIKNANTSFAYEPSRLRKNQTSVDAINETTFGSQKLDIADGVSLFIRTEKTERLRGEVFFSENDDNGTVISGCFITKEATPSADWSVSFTNVDRFLVNLSNMFTRP
jgi:hypothetical protein